MLVPLLRTCFDKTNSLFSAVIVRYLYNLIISGEYDYASIDMVITSGDDTIPERKELTGIRL